MSESSPLSILPSSFFNQGLEHQQAKQVRGHLWFHGEATDAHRNGLSDAAMGFGQRVGPASDVLLDGRIEFFPAPERDGNQFALLHIAAVGVGVRFFEERED